MSNVADVVIIGGGVNGCAAAYYLAKSGVKNVAVLEASKSIGHGGSSRNGGGVRQSGRDVRVMVVPEKVSDEDARVIAQQIRDRIQDEMQFPGQIKVSVIRETRAIEIAK